MAINIVIALSLGQIRLFLGIYAPGCVAAFFTIFKHYLPSDGRAIPLAIVGVIAQSCEGAALAEIS